MITFENGYWKENGLVLSMPPAETDGLCYQYFIPPYFCPKVLLLGVCGDTGGRLIAKIYPETIFTRVDIQAQPEVPLDHEQDAFDFVRETTQIFDYAVVDIWSGLSSPRFVYSSDFYAALAKITPLAAIDIAKGDAAKVDYSASFTLVSETFSQGNSVLFLRANA